MSNAQQQQRMSVLLASAWFSSATPHSLTHPLSCCFAGLFVFYCFPYGWSFDYCMLFGSILAATDPVAVVSLLKELGANPRLTMVITGKPVRVCNDQCMQCMLLCIQVSLGKYNEAMWLEIAEYAQLWL